MEASIVGLIYTEQCQNGYSLQILDLASGDSEISCNQVNLATV